ncbi:Meiotic nuclear division protein 1 [Trebouxia sp. C0010 RCD-2024]
MSKKRGLSLEEKRDKVLEIFHETKDVFQLKDIEKLATKKGVISQSVKEVLQSLVDDDMVHQEKIGISNFFWAFPGEAALQLEAALVKAQTQVKHNEEQCSNLQQKLQSSVTGRQETAEREAKLAEVATHEKQLRDIQNQLEQYAENDPDKINSMKEAAGIAKDAANRWLDNIEYLQDWCKKRFEGMGEQLNGFFKENGYTENMETFD